MNFNVGMAWRQSCRGTWLQLVCQAFCSDATAAPELMDLTASRHEPPSPLPLGDSQGDWLLTNL